jgi:hypothetical protein
MARILRPEGRPVPNLRLSKRLEKAIGKPLIQRHDLPST